ncbi:MAG: hypothetical protein IT186_20720 [Acidobacteria bacterium]|nr:hypothetical protein [Acidobacteriota bacterium]
MIALLAFPLLFAQAITGPEEVPVPAVTRGAPLDPKPFAYRRTFETGSIGWKRLDLDAHVLSASRDLADLRLVTGGNVQIPYILERSNPPVRVPLPPLEKTDLPGVKVPASTSVYRVELPFPSIPRSTLTVTALDPVFERDIVIHAPAPGHDRRLDRSLIDRIYSGTYAHRDPGSPPDPLEIELPPVRGRHLYIEVREGDNAPLRLQKPELALQAYRLRFYVDAAEPLTLLYGNPDVRPPLYDSALETLRVPENSIGPLALPPAPPVPSVDEQKEQKGRVLFWAALGLSIVALLFLVARLVRGGEPSE